MNILVLFLSWSTSIVYAESISSIVEKYPKSIQYRHLASCQNTCGRNTGLCSCRSKCQILKNCCEDFTQLCPEEFQKTDGIRHILGASISCHASGIFMVDLCSSDSAAEASEIIKTSNSTTSLIGTDGDEAYKKPTVNAKSEIEYLQFILEKRPVLDLLNGVAFSSMQTYHCNALNQSRPSVWDVLIGSKWDVTHLEDESELNGLVPQIDLGHYIYIPPTFLNQSLKDDFCIPNAVTQCPEEVLSTDPETYQKCSSFISYVMNSMKYIYYNNVYCMKCWESQTTHFVLITNSFFKPTRNIFLTTLMSVTDKGLTLQQMDAKSSRLPWSEIVCPLNESTGWKTPRLDCPLSYVCRPEAVLLPSGVCKFERRIRVSIGDAGIPLTLAELDQLPRLFSCIFQNEYSMETLIDFNQSGVLPPFRFYDNLLQMTLYSFEINIFWHYSESDILWDEFFQAVDIASKTYSEYRERRGRVSTPSVYRPTEENNKIRDVSDVSANVTHFDDIEYLTRTRDFIRAKGNIEVQGEGKTPWYMRNTQTGASRLITSCACMENRELQNICTLFCWQLPVFRDEITVIKRHLEASCLPSGFGLGTSPCYCPRMFLIMTSFTFTHAILTLL